MPTRLLASGTIVQGRLEGALVLYGMGDPRWARATSADWADQLAGQLAAHGLRCVHGDLIADDSYFAGPLIGCGWEADDLQSWFAVPSSALSVQENIARVTVTPGAAPGKPAQLTVDTGRSLPCDRRVNCSPRRQARPTTSTSIAPPAMTPCMRSAAWRCGRPSAGFPAGDAAIRPGWPACSCARR